MGSLKYRKHTKVLTMNRDPRIDATDETRVETSIARSCPAVSGPIVEDDADGQQSSTIELLKKIEESEML